MHTGLVEYCYNLKTVSARYARTWLVIDVVSCLPVECMIGAAGVTHNYNLGHLCRCVALLALAISPWRSRALSQMEVHSLV